MLGNVSQIIATEVGKAGFMGGFLGGMLAGFITAFFILFLALIFAVYIYYSLAFIKIAKKAKYKSPNIAWIPIVGPLLITSKTAKMNWWPILLILGFSIPVLGSLCYLAFAVFSTIWLWKTFEKIKVTNWLSILCLIPILNLIIIGIAAFKKK